MHGNLVLLLLHVITDEHGFIRTDNICSQINYIGSEGDLININDVV